MVKTRKDTGMSLEGGSPDRPNMLEEVNSHIDESQAVDQILPLDLGLLPNSGDNNAQTHL